MIRSRGNRNQAPKTGGQALVELLILLPVLLLLFLGTTEIAKLFAISGKTEVAARYLALRHFRNVPFALPGHDYTAPLEEEEDYPSDLVKGVFFEGPLLNPDDTYQPTIGYEEFGSTDFDYMPPDTDNPLWDIAIAVDEHNDLLRIRAHRVTFTDELTDQEGNPSRFPFGWRKLPGMWSESSGPVGPLTAVGDFVVLTDTFSGDTAEFLDLLAANGLILAVAPGMVSAAIAIIIYLIFSSG